MLYFLQASTMFVLVLNAEDRQSRRPMRRHFVLEGELTVYFNLIHSRHYARLRRNELIQMLDSEVTDASDFDLTILNGVFYRSPTRKSCAFPTVWTVKQEQVNIPKATCQD
jgi:hypothetical protein